MVPRALVGSHHRFSLVRAHHMRSSQVVSAPDGVAFALEGHVAIVGRVVLGVILSAEALEHDAGELTRVGHSPHRVFGDGVGNHRAHIAKLICVVRVDGDPIDRARQHLDHEG